MNEKDNDYRNRLIECVPNGHVNTCEDLANASGAELDAIGAIYNCPRKVKPLPSLASFSAEMGRVLLPPVKR